MKICTNCQHENPASANFCNNCGSKLTTSDRETAPSQTRIKKSKRAAERRQLTILFCDLVGSTPLSEKLDPEEYRQVITDYHEVAEKVIRKYGGHVAQYLGDGLLVYFGYPEGLEDAPRAGVQAGLGILDAVAQANLGWEAAGRAPIEIRIGIHTGLVVVDDHLALGETVNVAARLEGLAPHNGLVVSPQTRKLVEGWFEMTSTGKHRLKGITEPMEVFQVLGETGARSRLEVTKRRGLSPLVGRSQELKTLKEHWVQAKNGEGSLLLLNGEAGIGKSRLVDTLEEEVKGDEEAMLLEARCSAYQRNSAFFPLIDLLEKSMLKFESDDEPETKLQKLENFLLGAGLDFKTAMPLMAEFLSIPSENFPPLVMSPIAKRQLTISTLSKILLSQAANGPMLFILEDLHWADASTLEWLQQFMGQLPGQPVLLLCTTRPAYRPTWTDHPAVTVLTLERLSPEDMSDICHHQSRGKTLPAEILSQVIDKTEGVPLFVEELTRMILESDMLVEEEGSYDIAGPVSALAIPSTLQDSLLARLDRLSDAKEIVQTGAVLGREFSFEMLEAVLARKRESMERSLFQLQEAEIFYQIEEGPSSVYQFKHALIQDAAYESLLKSRRQQLHHRVANVLEHQFEEKVEAQPELLAHHYTEAGHPQQAIPLWLKAGQLASKKHANAEAIAQLEKGMTLLSNIKTEKERREMELDFRLALGGAFVPFYGFPHPKVGAMFNQALEIARTIEPSPKLALILEGLITYYGNREKYDVADQLIAYALELGQDPEYGHFFEVRGRYFSSTFGVLKGDFENSLRAFYKCLEVYDPAKVLPLELTPGGDLKVAAIAWNMIALQICGYMDQARRQAEQQLASAVDYSESRTLYHIHTFPSLYSLEAREWKSAEKIIADYLPIVREFGDPVFMLTAEVYHNIARGFQGEKTAFQAAAQLVNTCLEIGFNAFAATMSSYLAEQYLLYGEADAGRAWTDRMLDHVNRSGSHIHTAELYRLKGLALQELGEPEAMVEENLLQALEWSRKRSAKTYELRSSADLARLWKKQGKAREAKELLKGVYDWFTEGLDSVDLKDARALLREL